MRIRYFDSFINRSLFIENKKGRRSNWPISIYLTFFLTPIFEFRCILSYLIFDASSNCCFSANFILYLLFTFAHLPAFPSPSTPDVKDVLSPDNPDLTNVRVDDLIDVRTDDLKKD